MQCSGWPQDEEHKACRGGPVQPPGGGDAAAICGEGLGLDACTACYPEYTGWMCADCAEQHYRLNEECMPCPGTPFYVYAIGIGVAVSTAVYTLYSQIRKAVNNAMARRTGTFADYTSVTIAVTFLQILSMNARSSVAAVHSRLLNLEPFQHQL